MMELTPEQRKIIDLVNQLPDDIKENTLEIMSQMHISAETTKKDLKDVMMSPDVTKEEKEMLEKYKATQKVVDEFHQFCLKLSEKETPDFFDRFALSVESISQLTIPLLNIWGKQVWFAEKGDIMINSLKSDLVKTYITRYFSPSGSPTDFNNDLNHEIPKKIKNFNDLVGESKSKIDINKIDENSTMKPIADFNKELITVLEKIDKFEKNQEFIDKMWNNFVKDFVEKADKITSPRNQSGTQWEGKEFKFEEYKSWFFEHLFNIAYHTADYIDNIKNDTSMRYNFNYQFLHNNFDIEKTDHYDFQLNHIEKSTTYSNIVYKLAEELGIKKLKVLIGKYLIKP